MSETDFILLWKEHYEKIDQSLAINKRLLKELLSQKASSAVQTLIRGKAFGIAAATIYLLILGAALTIAVAFTIVHHSPAATYFIVSIGAIFLINIKALYDYIRHLILINRIRYDESVTSIQSRLSRLHWALVRHCRIMVLQFPFWSTFFLSSTWFPGHTPPAFIAIQIAVTGLLTYIAFWLYRNLTLANRDNFWIKIFISSVGGKEVVAAMGFYKELEDLSAIDD
jgi:hypothetical protein